MLSLSGAGPSAAGVAGGTSALYQSLVAFWKLDEASGSRADSIGSNTLTDNNTVASDTGLAYAAAGLFVNANSEYLSRASEATLQMGDIDFWIAAYVYPTALPDASRMIVAKDNSTAGQREYALHIRASSNGSTFALEVFRATDSSKLVASATFGAALLNTWHTVVGWHNAAADTVNISVNAGAADSLATTGALQAASAAEFRVGARQYATAEGYADMRIGPVMVAKGYIPDADDLTFLHNAGAGRTLQAIYEYAG